MKRHNLKMLWSYFTLFVFLGLPIYLFGSLYVMDMAEKSFGIWARIIVGILALVGFFMVFMRYLYRFGDWLNDRERDEAREKYRGIYRVLAPPNQDKRNTWQLQNIEIGDYGWEAKPRYKNGLIYLHGLTTEWGWVWWAGFRPDQIEYVGLKPISQYDWKDFEYNGPKPRACYQWQSIKPKALCPFPVKAHTTRYRLQFPI
jgi:hypothetical protein